MQYLFSEKYYDSTLSEAPDIISVNNDIGVEVTSSIVSAVHEATSRSSDITGKTDDMLTRINIENISKGRVVTAKTSTGEYLAGFSRWGNTHDIEGAFCKKLKKLNLPHYKFFRENNLFIFAWLIDDKELLNGIEAIFNQVRILKSKLNLKTIQFDYVYIFLEGQLVNLSLKNYQIEKYMLNSEELDMISNEAFVEIFGISREEYYRL